MDFLKRAYYNKYVLEIKFIKRGKTMKKFLYEKTKIKTAENGDDINLEYFLLEDELEIENYTLKSYGIEIKKTICSDFRDLSEVKQIPNVFFRKKEAVSFLKSLCEGGVTPTSLAGILEDYISESIHEKNRIPMII